MAEVIVSTVVKQLAEITKKEIQKELRLVRGVKKEILHLSSELTTISNVLEDAERRGYKEKSIQHWLNKLEETSYDIADVLDEWKYAMLKLRIEGPKLKVCLSIPSSCLFFKKVTIRHDIATKIKGLKESLDMVVNEKDRYNFIEAQPVATRKSDRVKSTSLIDVSEIQGREYDKDVLVSKLILEGASQEESGPRVISIVGTGGIGKTTLAQLVYNDDQVTNSFKKKIWICVSDVSDEAKIAKGIVEQVEGSSPNLNELESLLKSLADSVSGEKFLLVLDDIWTEYCTKWEPLKSSLKCGGPGSKILITTRSERVARMMGTTENGIHHLGQLSDKDCWLLMRRLAFLERTDADCKKLQDIGKKIANKCKGLPLAAKVLGGHLRFKDTMEEWENVLNNEIWQMEEVKVELFPHLFLGYNELSPALKLCFSYCAVFPKDSVIHVANLIKMWMAQGYLSSGESTSDLEFRGKEYFDNLRMRSFFQDFKKYKNHATCKMHDIVHDFARFLRNNKRHNMEDPNGRVEATTNEPFHFWNPSSVPEIKVYRSLICNFELPNSRLIKSLRVLMVSNWADINIVVEDLIHLRYLDLNHKIGPIKFPQKVFKLYNLETLSLSSCWLKEIPKEIGNLVNLRHLNLSYNEFISELPETICNLHNLYTLNLECCYCLVKLPKGIDRLVNLTHIPNFGTSNLVHIPQGLEQLTGLRTLNCYNVGRGSSKLGYLNKLDKLSGFLELNIDLHDTEDVVKAQKAELRNKMDIETLKLEFDDSMEKTDKAEPVRNDVMEALQPSPNLLSLEIDSYNGTKFPGWITSSLDHLISL
ncbi:hypothetical protein BUALT_Bualt07G0156300 [Buddleja alternifolia]|uniref:Uncharacterized protein n=1 Tax=Buddleja alternifolia TaxID=168488 RepID=A0AAV6XCB6_9LAMI|nr:hypothetical protein BUALT_Bualt07G0156300 [Buddleja alternifolia]